METTIRKATPKDLHTLQLLNALLFKSESEWHPTLNRKWMYEEDGTNYLKSRLRGGNKVTFIAEREGRPIGYITGGILKILYRKEKVFAELENLYIIEEARGLGVGKTLLEFFKLWAKGKKAKIIKVEAAFRNEQACSFYKSQGFEEYEIIMEKKI